MGWWKADPVPPTEPTSTIPNRIPANHPPVADGVNQDSCPVDHKTREIWLQAAKKQREQSRDTATKSLAQPPTTQDSRPVDQASQQSWLSMATSIFSSSSSTSPPAQTRPQPQPQPTATPTPTSQKSPDAPTTRQLLTPEPSAEQCSSETVADLPQGPSVTYTHGKHTRTLSHDREVSSIPRGAFHSTANNEQETGTSASGNWIYPSETQFFNAVMRKATTTTSPEDLAGSVSTIIPIHNAVNERAWAMIRKWEGDSSRQCGGPKLVSFKGLGAGAQSPRAKWKAFWGALEPFDRHDWVVERCDRQQVEYVIDFYQGREREDVAPKRRAQELNFYLDVRPKLNSFEGCRMRFERYWGLN